MKKFLLLSSFILANFTLLYSQSIEIMRDGAAFSLISPSSKYIAGNIDDLAIYYNVETKVAKSLAGEVLDDGGCFVWDLNDNGQLAVDWKKQAAIWTEEAEYDLLPFPEGLTSTDKAYSAARCITNDGKTIVVSFGSPTSRLFVYSLNDENTFDMVELPMPKEDPIFHQNPQFIAPMGINDDATRIMGRYRIDTGLEELPFVWEKNDNGEWSIRWIALDFIVEGGKTDAVYPGEFEWDGSGYDVESGEYQEEYDKAYAEYEKMWKDYELAISSIATGYYYSGAGSLSGIRMSKNGKYANVQISYERTNSSYPAVLDLDNDTVYVFTCRPNAGCLSVTNDGIITIQGVMDYFSWTFVSSIEDVTKSQTLAAWTLEKSNNAIDLAEYMKYGTPNGMQVAEGTATLSSSGNGFVTWQYNGFGDDMRYETIVVRFDTPLADEVVLTSDMSVYPNPTSGVVYFEKQLQGVVVYDVAGRQVYAQSVAEQYIDLSVLNSGTYILTAQSEGESVVTKVVITK